MQSETFQRTNLAERNYERYLEFTDQRTLTDELTEASEKLAMVMNNPFDFKMHSDGELYAEDGSNLGDVLQKSVIVAEEMVRTNPQFITELIRRRFELQEYDKQRRLALSGTNDADVLVVVSPIPDEVLSQKIDLGAYDLTRKKTLVRIYERLEGGIRSTSISLDGTDRQGLQAIARQFGQTIPEDAGSEDILAMRLWGYSSVLGDPIKTVRRRYDEQLEQQNGGQWYGGRQDGEVIDALSFIVTQSDIIKTHMQRMKQIETLPFRKRQAARETARYNFAASLDERRSGKTVIGGGVDLAAAGNSARAAGIEYKSDCPTGSEAQTTTAQEASQKLFEKSEEKAMTCPFCGLTTYGDPCAFRLICNRCSAEVRGGKLMSKGIGRKAALEQEAKSKLEQKIESEKKIDITRKIGKAALPVVFKLHNKYYENKQVIGIGGMVHQIREVSADEWSLRQKDLLLAV